VSSGLPDPQVVNLLKASSRLVLAKIWKAGQAGEELNAEEERYYRVMLEHEEYHDLWDSLEYVYDKDIMIDGVSPFLHITIHAVIEEQVAKGQPPEVVETLERLQRAGLDRHEAIHRIGRVFGRCLWSTLQAQKPFDATRYVSELRELRP